MYPCSKTAGGTVSRLRLSVVFRFLGQLVMAQNFGTTALWVKQCLKPPTMGNGKHATYKNGDGWGKVYGIVLPTLL